jgi:hypothetical protein
MSQFNEYCLVGVFLNIFASQNEEALSFYTSRARIARVVAFLCKTSAKP